MGRYGWIPNSLAPITFRCKEGRHHFPSKTSRHMHHFEARGVCEVKPIFHPTPKSQNVYPELCAVSCISRLELAQHLIGRLIRIEPEAVPTFPQFTNLPCNLSPWSARWLYRYVRLGRCLKSQLRSGDV